MRKKKYVGISSIALIVIMVVLFFSMKNAPFDDSSNQSEEQAATVTTETINETEEQTATTTNEKNNDKKSVTAMEALRLGYSEAKKQTEEEPLLISITSTDDTSIPQERSDGADGTRDAWNLEFGSKKGNVLIYIKIDNGVAITTDVKKHDKNLLEKGHYAISDIQIDSSDAVKQAVEMGMKPGNPAISDDWIKGYHFTIGGYNTDPNSSKTRLLLRVMGISPNSPNRENESLRMSIFFDAQTGEVVSATEMTGYDKDGNTMWKNIELKH
ncbi:hypothetical protein H8B09_21255 [Paenibacillus sp. PR3]|uniref:Uncharacterized protein n=1 Tax=Paenibacillus terricola TaxID=2763503 RepID=A0ABR8N0D4_9BACL|nr:hypothetical protein [Paenibacillus terricola]MBD3921310.1 hypothetical protein [Paenibacillus terricola]